MKKKILHVINSMQPGGAEILLVNSLSPGGLCEHTENHLAYFNAPTYLLERLDKNVKVHFLDYKGTTDLLRMVKDLRKIITENKIDIVHSHLNPASWYTAFACPKHVPHIHTVHIAYSTDLDTRPALKFLEKKLFFNKKNCSLIFLSEFTEEDFMRFIPFRGKGFVLHNFIGDDFFLHPPKEYRGSAEGGLRLLAIGFLRQQKNYFYLLEIFRHLKEHNIQLDIYGGGDQEKYSRVINDNGLQVTLKGPVTDVNAVIAGYDLFIMSSTNEGFPLSVFEAMAAGIPLMLSNIKPLTNIVKDNAIYFDLDNAEKAAQQLIAVLQNKTDINTMAVNAKGYAEKMARREIYIDKLLKIYDEIHTA